MEYQINVVFLQYNCKNEKIMAAVLDKQTSDKVAFISFIIPEFAVAFKMSMPNAYNYLVRYGGFDFLNEHWWALHTDNKYWTLLDIYDVCRQNGGYLR